MLIIILHFWSLQEYPWTVNTFVSMIEVEGRMAFGCANLTYFLQEERTIIEKTASEELGQANAESTPERKRKATVTIERLGTEPGMHNKVRRSFINIP